MTKLERLIGWGLLTAFAAASLAMDGLAAWAFSEDGTRKAALFVMGLTVLACFGIKMAGVPRMVRAFASGQWGRGLALLPLIALATAISVYFEQNFYAQTYGDWFKGRSNAVVASTDFADEKRQIEARLADRTTLRTPEQVMSAVDLALAKRVGQTTLGVATSNCLNPAAPAYAFHCPQVLTLRVEHSAAVRYAADEARLAVLRGSGVWLTRVSDPHAGLALISGYLSVVGVKLSPEGVLHVVLFATMIFMQLGTMLVGFCFLGDDTPRGARRTLSAANDATPAIAGNIIPLPARVGGAPSSELAEAPEAPVLPEMGAPEATALATREMEREVSAFVARHVVAVRRPDAFILTSDLYRLYDITSDFAPTVPQPIFYRLLRAEMHKRPGVAHRKDTKGLMGYYGVELAPTARALLRPARAEAGRTRAA